MNLEQLKRGNEIDKELQKCELNIKLANYTQRQNVVIIETYLKVNGLDESIEIPERLFRVVGKLILSEYDQKMIQLEKELRSL